MQLDSLEASSNTGGRTLRVDRRVSGYRGGIGVQQTCTSRFQVIQRQLPGCHRAMVNPAQHRDGLQSIGAMHG